jgi:Na+-driven multidrug efflux pump
MGGIMNHSQSLGEEKISTLLWRFSLPAITGMVVNAFYNVIDSVFVGRGVGEIGLTAVTIAFPIMIVLMGLGMLVGVGAAAVVSLRIGEKKQQEAEKNFRKCLHPLHDTCHRIFGLYLVVLRSYFKDSRC